MEINKICEALDKKFDDILSLFDSPLKEKLKKNLYFAGDCIYSLWNDKKPKDYDLFSKIDLTEDLKVHKWACITEYAHSLGDFQIITKFCGEPDECVADFDFKHNCYYYIPYSSVIKFGLDELDDEVYNFDLDRLDCPKVYNFLHTNQLYFNDNRARDVERVMLRVNKFLKRGMKITRAERNKIKGKIDKPKLKKLKKEYQRTGVSRSNRGNS